MTLDQFILRMALACGAFTLIGIVMLPIATFTDSQVAWVVVLGAIWLNGIAGVLVVGALILAVRPNPSR